ncbi:gliding motility-associated ABC transporter substrate-binding protein GldG [Paraflavitalea sp. CAU 1676]|uniref:gliding motility-associated ABC transporter substrate-binding protein GldG n=1 Tax=Paraflavitalea sp. CAU 1676 TaxID=3032598 RepID=UPI0023DA59A2|nr:gliding motility-associated ABC transporter substrate-binding protein GldG [Paraflavitalea sp. CAU 1676]MDF2187282.1 gliding motility-associated ABC transporter substrate-binding protein GldG [Paraflavitalea sp. CAU 1676]
MKKLFATKYWWIYLLIVLVGVNYLASQFHFRLDLTQEKRFTLSTPTKKLLSNLNDPVTVTVFLDGDMPAGFKRLANSTRELLQEFKENGKGNIHFRFQRPGSDKADTAGVYSMDSLMSLGLKPTNVRVKAKEGEGEEQRYLFPGAIVTYHDRIVPVDFLQSSKVNDGDPFSTLNNADALLEFKLAHAIQKITAETVPAVGYLLGNGEPMTYNVYDLIEGALKPNYGFGFVPIDSVKVIPQYFNALVVMKPTKAFTNEQKLKIDQYIMHGGKVIWLLDKLDANLDSLMRKNGDFVAFDFGLNLDDQFFKYGVRINADLVQDLQCDRIPMVVGSMGDKPQTELQSWPYFPLLSSYSNNPIAKNMDQVLSLFPSSIDTVKAPGIQKTVLLATSSNARTLSTPAIVSLNSIKTEEDMKTFNKANIPVAVLLEGKFSSLFTNRLSQATMDTMAGLYKQPFRAAPAEDNKMIVIADADIATNVFSQAQGPLPMGFNQFTNYQYANKDFILNCIEYLVNPSGILETRSKDYTLRLLDPEKVETQKTTWQLVNIGVPVLLVLLFGFIYQAIRKRKYQ